MNEVQREEAKRAYATIKKALDERKWSYEADDEQLSVSCSVQGQDLPIRLVLFLEPEVSMIRVFSPFSFTVPEEKRVDLAIATLIASSTMANGSLDYSLADGHITYRMAQPYQNSIIGPELIDYLVDCACSSVDVYNDQFLAITKGYLSTEDFLKRTVK